MSAQLYNVAPDAIADPGTPGGPGFTLARPEWIAIQTASTDAQALPTTYDAFRDTLGPGAPGDLSDFGRLLEAYDAMRGHAVNWTDTIFPACVSLADDVHRYGTVQAPACYPRILQEAEILERNPHDERARTTLKALLEDLKHEVELKSGRAEDVADVVAEFLAASEVIEATVVGDDGPGGLVAHYTHRYGPGSTEVEELIADIAEQQGIVTAANDAYNQDVVVTTTTPTYSWMWPLGSVAVPVVGGAYGQRATGALDRVRRAQVRIASLADDEAALVHLLIALDHAAAGASALVRGLTESLPMIRKIRGVWGGIAADLVAISALLDDDVRQVPPVIRGLEVDQAIQAWHQVALRADAYRGNAFVEERPGRHSMAAWKPADRATSGCTVSTLMAAARYDRLIHPSAGVGAGAGGPLIDRKGSSRW